MKNDPSGEAISAWHLILGFAVFGTGCVALTLHSLENDIFGRFWANFAYYGISMALCAGLFVWVIFSLRRSNATGARLILSLVLALAGIGAFALFQFFWLNDFLAGLM